MGSRCARGRIGGVWLIAALAVAAPGYGQGPSAPDTTEEMVVTAQKREQSLRDVPLAITAFDGETLESANVQEFTDLYRMVPGLASAPDYAFIELTTIRGIGTNSFGFGADPAIGVYVNGIYQGRNGTQTSAFFDVERVEVVKGPQATLFGRSSIAGAISVVNRTPIQEPERSLGVSFGERWLFGLDAMWNEPVGERFAVRGAIHLENEDGFLDNRANGDELRETEVGAARLSAKWFGDAFEALVMINYEARDEEANVYQPQGIGLDDWDVESELDEDEIDNDTRTFDVMAELTWDLSETLTLTSLSGWRNTEFDYSEDFDGLDGVFLSSPFLQEQDDDLLQEELRLLWENDAGFVAIAGVAGYYEHLDGFAGNVTDTGIAFGGRLGDFTGVPLYEEGDFEGHYWGWSAYLDVTVPLFLEGLSLTAGTRYAFDEKELEADVADPRRLAANAGNPDACACYLFGYYTSRKISETDDWDDTTFRAALTYEASEAVTVYAAWAEGWKAGGVDTFSTNAPARAEPRLFRGWLDLARAGGTLDSFDPETSESWEVGAKTSLWDGRLRANLAPYYYTYEDLQVNVLRGAAIVVENLGRVRGRGVELDAALEPFTWLSLGGAFAYTSTKILEDEEDPNEVGRPLVHAPKVSFALNGEVRAPAPGGEAFLAALWTYQDDFRGSRGFEADVDSYDLLDLRAGYRADADWTVEVFVENVFDAFEGNFLVPAERFAVPITTLSAFGRPRTLGVQARVSW